jgi:hypothetical protein
MPAMAAGRIVWVMNAHIDLINRYYAAINVPRFDDYDELFAADQASASMPPRSCPRFASARRSPRSPASVTRRARRCDAASNGWRCPTW